MDSRATPQMGPCIKLVQRKVWNLSGTLHRHHRPDTSRFCDGSNGQTFAFVRFLGPQWPHVWRRGR